VVEGGGADAVSGAAGASFADDELLSSDDVSADSTGFCAPPQAAKTMSNDDPAETRRMGPSVGRNVGKPPS
jgi:hypothetical protein